ncbi:MAG TPA: hypothetical protein VG815_14115 [Chloroflexota bacterium]|jgi:hypothetical protein|nr:hypothetical protein [Chloroflexota bacterium]
MARLRTVSVSGFAVAAVLFAVWTGVQARVPGSHRAATCGGQHTLTIANDGVARLYGNAADHAFACDLKNGKNRWLQGASASQDAFSLSGLYAAWSSNGHEKVNVVEVDTGAIPNSLPYNTNDYVVRIVVKNDGAVAWAANTTGANPYVQGLDRKNHPPDQFSDDTKYVRGGTLHPTKGHGIAWSYTDGSSGSANLF